MSKLAKCNRFLDFLGEGWGNLFSRGNWFLDLGWGYIGFGVDLYLSNLQFFYLKISNFWIFFGNKNDFLENLESRYTLYTLKKG